MSASIVLSENEYKLILRNDLASFIERSFYELRPGEAFIPGQYIELLAASLEKCRRGKTKRLIVNLPPRTLKSHAASVAFSAWLHGHEPCMEIICASYAQALADKLARDCRMLMGSAFYRGLFPKTTLSPEKSSVEDFMTTMRGSRLATSVNGSLTGRGADVIILDDVMKPTEALSETLRQNANEWYSNSLMSRLNSKERGVIIIVMQRLHQEDLIGVIMEREPWEVLSLPAIARQDEHFEYEDLFGRHTFERSVGKVLHPERDPLSAYESLRKTMTEYDFQCQFQQDPMPLGGNIIKREWLRFCEPANWPKSFPYILQSWDTANKSGDRNDFSVCTTWGLHDGKYYLCHVFRQRLGFPELKRAVAELKEQFDPSKVLIEDKSSGTPLIQALASEYVFGIEACQIPPGSNKYVRLAAQSIKFEAGKVILPTQASWLEEYVREITGYPGSKYDDQVDSTTQALECLGPMAGLTINDNYRWPPQFGYETC